MKIGYSLILAIFLLSVFSSHAGSNVVLNEVAWMGSKDSSSDEWIELYNATDSALTLDGWKLQTKDGGVDISLKGTIEAHGFFLLERTDDSTIEGISADQFFSGSLANTGEVMILKDASGNEVDSIDATGGWPAGDNTTKDTMQRSASGWISAAATPRAANATASTAAPLAVPPSPEPQTQMATTQPQPVVSVPVSYPASFYISEFLPDPDGADENAEWIEIYNASDKAEVIGGFFLDDAANGSRPYKIPVGVSVPPKGFLVFKRTETKIALNNTSDEVRLLYPNQQAAATVSYTDVKENMAGAYDSATRVVTWTSTPTPGTPNTLKAMVIAVPSAAVAYQQASVASLDDLPNTTFAASSSVVQQSAVQRKGANGGNTLWTMLFALLLGAAAMFGYLKFFKRTALLLAVVFIVGFPTAVWADTFPVLQEIDSKNRTQVEADAVRSAEKSLIYVERGLSIAPELINDLGSNFDSTIYPKLTTLFGSPFDTSFTTGPIIILIADITFPEGGYFISTQRNVLYLNASFIDTTSRAKGILAHEFQHLIAYTQKNVRLEKGEERWINEMRSEYASTYSGFGERFLKERTEVFKIQPFVQLPKWADTLPHYGVVSMFGHYLAARFGEDVFRKEMATNSVNRQSAQQAFTQFDPTLTFAKVYGDWRLTNYVNDKGLLNGKYSYNNTTIDVRLKSEATTSFSSPTDPPQTITTTISTYNSGAVTFFFDNNRSKITFSTPEKSSDLVVNYLAQAKDGTYRDGQFTLEQGTVSTPFSKDTAAALFVMSNVADNIPQTTFTMNAQVIAISQPIIRSIDPVILSPNAINTKYFLRGEDFDPASTITVNGQLQEGIFINEKTLLISIDPALPQADIVLKNPDGQTATFTWSKQSKVSMTISPISDGALIRAKNDYKVYIVKDGFIRHIVSPALFTFYPHLGFSVVKVIDPEQALGYQESRLIRAAGDSKVYEVLPDGKKRWIQTAQEFVTRGFDWNAIFEVNSKELNFYPATL